MRQIVINFDGYFLLASGYYAEANDRGSVAVSCHVYIPIGYSAI
jgi:hypothetical protein